MESKEAGAALKRGRYSGGLGTFENLSLGYVIPQKIAAVFGVQSEFKEEVACLNSDAELGL